jgi:YggT family protein
LPDIVCSFLNLYLLVLFVRIVLSWFPTAPGTFLAQVNSGLYAVTEPVLGPIRRAIPPVRFGGAGLDLSPMVVLIGLPILMRLVGC